MAQRDQQDPNVVEQSTEKPVDQADAEEPGVEETDEESTAGDSTDESEEEGSESKADGTESADDDDDDEGDDELLSDEDLKKVEGNPAELRKALNKAWTQKTQRLSEDRKILKPYLDLVAAMEDNPRVAVLSMAKALGIKVEGDTKVERKEVTRDLTAAITEKLKAGLGEEYADIAEKLGPALKAVVEDVVNETTKEDREKVDQVLSDSVMREAGVHIEAFTKKYPNWQKFEKQMVALSEKLPIGKGMSEGEYLEALYTLVTKDGAVGDRAKKIIKRMEKSAKNSGDRQTTASDKTVSRSPGKSPTFAEAAAAARRGERFD